MSVKIIYKNQGAEVTDKMLLALAREGYQLLSNQSLSLGQNAFCDRMRQAMESARETEIERIYVDHPDQQRFFTVVVTPDHVVFTQNFSDRVHVDQIEMHKDNIIPLAEALLEMGGQLKKEVRPFIPCDKYGNPIEG